MFFFLKVAVAIGLFITIETLRQYICNLGKKLLLKVRRVKNVLNTAKAIYPRPHIKKHGVDGMWWGMPVLLAFRGWGPGCDRKI